MPSCTRSSASGLSAHDRRRVSVAGPADPRTVEKFLRGEDVSPMVYARLERAMRELGFERLVPKKPTRTARPTR